MGGANALVLYFLISLIAVVGGTLYCGHQENWGTFSCLFCLCLFGLENCLTLS